MVTNPVATALPGETVVVPRFWAEQASVKLPGTLVTVIEDQ
jgi:hypothetical protein